MQVWVSSLLFRFCLLSTSLQLFICRSSLTSNRLQMPKTEFFFVPLCVVRSKRLSRLAQKRVHHWSMIMLTANVAFNGDLLSQLIGSASHFLPSLSLSLCLYYLIGCLFKCLCALETSLFCINGILLQWLCSLCAVSNGLKKPLKCFRWHWIIIGIGFFQILQCR